MIEHIWTAAFIGVLAFGLALFCLPQTPNTSAELEQLSARVQLLETEQDHAIARQMMADDAARNGAPPSEMSDADAQRLSFALQTLRGRRRLITGYETPTERAARTANKDRQK